MNHEQREQEHLLKPTMQIRLSLILYCFYSLITFHSYFLSPRGGNEVQYDSFLPHWEEKFVCTGQPKTATEKTFQRAHRNKEILLLYKQQNNRSQMYKKIKLSRVRSLAFQIMVLYFCRVLTFERIVFAYIFNMLCTQLFGSPLVNITITDKWWLKWGRLLKIKKPIDIPVQYMNKVPLGLENHTDLAFYGQKW